MDVIKYMSKYCAYQSVINLSMLCTDTYRELSREVSTAKCRYINYIKKINRINKGFWYASSDVPGSVMIVNCKPLKMDSLVLSKLFCNFEIEFYYLTKRLNAPYIKSQSGIEFNAYF